MGYSPWVDKESDKSEQLIFLHFSPYLLSLATTSLFPTSSGLFACFLILHISEIMQYLSFFVWLISLSIIPASSIHVVDDEIVFLFMTE